MATDTVEIFLDPTRPEDYPLFLKIKALPRYRFRGHVAEVPAEYAAALGRPAGPAPGADYRPEPFLFDYQAAVTALAVRKRRFAAFMGCGLGKTLVMLSWARHVAAQLPPGQCVLITSPLMVIKQTIAEAMRFFGDSLPVDQVRAADLPRWVERGPGRVGITNYEAITDRVGRGRVGAMANDEAGTMKSHYGAWGRRLIEIGRGVEWKLSLTGTPAPNDRIEYGNQAVFLDQFPTINAFLARYFVNRGQTDNRWEIKPHALAPFYRDLSHWCIFLNDPATYGWRDNVGSIPPIHTHAHEVPLTAEQDAILGAERGDLFGRKGSPGGIVKRSNMAGLAKGRWKGRRVASGKAAFIRDLVATWTPAESTIVWCRFNSEQEDIERAIPGAASIHGGTPPDRREAIIADFQAGRVPVVVSKPKCMGYGLNLQVATRHVFNGLWDSSEEYIQCLKRSNRVGSTRPLNAHVCFTEIERPMVENTYRKLRRIDEDTAEQERTFRENRHAG